VLKRDRISQRLLGNFGFSDVLRSFDGAQYTLSTPTLNVTPLAARPTAGVFQVNGWPELNINVFYGALTKPAGRNATPESGASLVSGTTTIAVESSRSTIVRPSPETPIRNQSP